MRFKVFPTPEHIVKWIHFLMGYPKWFSFDREFWSLHLNGVIYNGFRTQEDALKAGREYMERQSSKAS